MKPLIAVTGAEGYIGARLVRGLAGDPAQRVRALTRSPVGLFPSTADCVSLDLLEPPDRIAPALTGADAVVHLAGPNETVASREPDRAISDTVAITRHVAEAATRAGVRRLVYVSTVHVYGAAMVPGALLAEELVPAPRSAYAVARLACEHLSAAATAASERTDLVVLRLTNAVGAPADAGIDRWSLVANDLCRQAVQRSRLELRTDGMQWRDFVAMSDVCRVIAAACRDDDRGPAVPAGTYNFGRGESLTVRRLAELVQDAAEAATGTRPELVAPDPTGDTPEPYRVVVDRLTALGLSAEATIRAALDETIAFCLDHRAEL